MDPLAARAGSSCTRSPHHRVAVGPRHPVGPLQLRHYPRRRVKASGALGRRRVVGGAQAPRRRGRGGAVAAVVVVEPVAEGGLAGRRGVRAHAGEEAPVLPRGAAAAVVAPGCPAWAERHAKQSPEGPSPAL